MKGTWRDTGRSRDTRKIRLIPLALRRPYLVLLVAVGSRVERGHRVGLEGRASPTIAQWLIFRDCH